MSLVIKALFSDYIHSKIDNNLKIADVDADRVSDSVNKVWEGVLNGSGSKSSFFRSFESFTKSAIKKTLKERVLEYNTGVLSKKDSFQDFNRSVEDAIKSHKENDKIISAVKQKFSTFSKKEINLYLDSSNRGLTSWNRGLGTIKAGKYLEIKKQIKDEKSSQDADFRKQINDLAIKYGISPKTVERMVYDSIFETSSDDRKKSYVESMKLMKKESRTTKELHLQKVEDRLRAPAKAFSLVFGITEEKFVNSAKYAGNVYQNLVKLNPMVRSLIDFSGSKAFNKMVLLIREDNTGKSSEYSEMVREILEYYKLDKNSLTEFLVFFDDLKNKSNPEWYSCLTSILTCAKGVYEIEENDKVMSAKLKQVIEKLNKKCTTEIDASFHNSYKDRKDVLSSHCAETDARYSEKFKSEELKDVLFYFAREGAAKIDLTLNYKGHNKRIIISEGSNLNIADIYEDIKKASAGDETLLQLIQFSYSQGMLNALQPLLHMGFIDMFPQSMQGRLALKFDTISKEVTLNSDGSVSCVFKSSLLPLFTGETSTSMKYVLDEKKIVGVPVTMNVTLKKDGKGKWHAVETAYKVTAENDPPNLVPAITRSLNTTATAAAVDTKDLSDDSSTNSKSSSSSSEEIK